MNVIVADFTEAERELVADLLQQRYIRRVTPDLADSEVKLDPVDAELTICPTLCWCERGANFVVCKIASGRYRGQFFYADADQYGTGHDESPDLQHCVLALLRVQADHEARSAGISSGATTVDLAAGTTDADYHGPVMI